MNDAQKQPEQNPLHPAEEPDVTMVDGGDKEAGEDPDFDEDEPEVLPDDPDILGEDAAVQPG